MEGEASTAVIAQGATKFTWTIANFSKLSTTELYSDVFFAGGCRWRLLIYPNGNGVNAFSIYLYAADSAISPLGWSKIAFFSITVVNQVHKQYSVTKKGRREFKASEICSGFHAFMPLDELYHPTEGFIVNDTCTVEIDVISCSQILRSNKRSKMGSGKANRYITIKVARDEDLVKQIGSVVHFDLVDHDKVHSFRVSKLTTFEQFKVEVAKVFGVPAQYQRFWLWARRQNNTYRPLRPLNCHETSRPVGHLREIPHKAINGELKLFLEVGLKQDLQPMLPPYNDNEDILLFFKLYDPLKEKLRYIGRMFVKGNGKPVEVLTKINELAGFAPDEKIELYEEICFQLKSYPMCEPLGTSVSFLNNQLENGDIICVQKSSKAGNTQQHRYPDVPSFLKFVRNKTSDALYCGVLPQESVVDATDLHSSDKEMDEVEPEPSRSENISSGDVKEFILSLQK